MCSTCVRPVRDVLYCEECLANIVGIPAPTPPISTPVAESQYQMPASGLPAASPSYARSNPVLAFFLGFLPGMGAFYNEQYGKGMIHLAIFLVLFISGVDGAMSGELKRHCGSVSLDCGSTCRLMPTARQKHGRPAKTLSDPLDAFTKERPIGPILLIGAGLLLLLHNFDWFPWYRISQFFWPAVLIAAGVLMMRKRLDRALRRIL